MWLAFNLISQGELPIISPLEFPMIPVQTFIPVLFNLAEGSSRWKQAKGRGKWIVWGERGVISAAKQLRHLFRGGDLRSAWQRGRKPRGQTRFRRRHGKSTLAVCVDKRGTGWIAKLPRIPTIETTQWYAGQFSAPLLKWSPIQFYVGHL